MDETERLKQRIGTTLRGKWTLERLLGVGGMAAVYVGVHKIGRRAAIKILHPDIAENKQLARRFELEAHAVNRFSHPGAVEIIDVDVSEDGAPFLVMELLAGESLADRIERSAMESVEVLRLMDELLDVLVAAHAHAIIHRDIKPDNLFVLQTGRLKVLDFGIAQMRQGAPQSMYTAVGTTIGTLTYMSPEQVAGKEIDGRADLFAVGCTMFRIVSGRSPHLGDTDLELMVKMAMEPAPPLVSIVPGASRELGMVVDRALAFDRERRYPDALTMQGDVRALREGRPPPFALSRLQAGDLPNPSAAAAPPASASWSQPMPSASAAWNQPTMAAMRYGAAGGPVVTSAPASAGWGAATPLGPHPASALAAPASRAKDKWIAVGMIAAMFLVLGIAVTVWWARRGSEGDDGALSEKLKATLKADENPKRGAQGASTSQSSSRDPRGKSGPGVKSGPGAKPPRSSPTVIVIPLSPSGEPLQGRYGDETEGE